MELAASGGGGVPFAPPLFAGNVHRGDILGKECLVIGFNTVSAGVGFSFNTVSAGVVFSFCSVVYYNSNPKLPWGEVHVRFS